MTEETGFLENNIYRDTFYPCCHNCKHMVDNICDHPEADRPSLTPTGKCRKFSYGEVSGNKFYDLCGMVEILSKWENYDNEVIFHRLDPEERYLKRAYRVVPSGKYTLYDYACGLYQMGIHLIKKGEYFLVRMRLTNADEGFSEAITGPIYDLEEATQIYDKLKDGLSVDKLKKIPSFKKFAKILSRLGLILDTYMD